MNETIEINTIIQNINIGNIIGNITQLSLIMNIFLLVSFLLKAWGLYNINKKLGETHPWLAFIPIIQFYSFVKAGGKPGIWILWIFLGFIAFIIPGIILIAMVCSGIAKRTGRGFWSAVGIFFIPSIMLPIIGYKFHVINNPNENKSDKITNKEETIKTNSNKNIEL